MILRILNGEEARVKVGALRDFWPKHPFNWHVLMIGSGSHITTVAIHGSIIGSTVGSRCCRSLNKRFAFLRERSDNTCAAAIPRSFPIHSTDCSYGSPLAIAADTPEAAAIELARLIRCSPSRLQILDNFVRHVVLACRQVYSFSGIASTLAAHLVRRVPLDTFTGVFLALELASCEPLDRCILLIHFVSDG